MALIKSVRGFTPQIGANTFLADNATIIGDVEIGEGCSIWFGTVIRGDVNSIRIGNGVKLIGMGAVVMDHAVVGEGAIVAAGSVVLSKTIIEPGSIYAGVPAKFVKKVDPEQSKEINQKIAKNYHMYASWYTAEEDKDNK